VSVVTNIEVNTLLIGAGRSGTTSFCDLLARQTGVCFSLIKEVHFFSQSDLYDRGPSYYNSFFEAYHGEPVVAGADTYLLIDPEGARRVHQYNPGMKIIVLLRDPVDRAFSSYNYSVNYGHHQAYDSFMESIEREKDIANEPSVIRRNNMGHFYGSLYAHHLKHWSDIFGRQKMLVLNNELLKDAEGLKARVDLFLGIDSDFSGMVRKNETALPRFRRFEQFLLNRELPLRKLLRNVVPGAMKRRLIRSGIPDQLHRVNRKKVEQVGLSVEEYREARAYFSDDLEQLEVDFGISFPDQSF